MNSMVAMVTAVLLGVLPDTPPRTEQIANGVTTQFFFNYKTTSAAHIHVFVDGAEQASGYAVALNASQDTSPGGSVTFSVPPVPSSVVRIDRTLPVSQDSVWVPFSAFKAKTLEGQLDYQAMLSQQLNRDKATKTDLAIESEDRIHDDQAETYARLDAEAAIRASVTAEANTRASEDTRITSEMDGKINDALTQGLTGAGMVPLRWTFTGDGTTARFAIPDVTNYSADTYIVSLSGVLQTPVVDYWIDLSAHEVVFVTPPAAGVTGVVRSFGYSRAVNVADNSYVQATGTTTSKPLRDWMADVVAGGGSGASVFDANGEATVPIKAPSFTTTATNAFVMDTGSKICMEATCNTFMALSGNEVTVQEVSGGSPSFYLISNDGWDYYIGPAIFNGTGVGIYTSHGDMVWEGTWPNDTWMRSTKPIRAPAITLGTGGVGAAITGSYRAVATWAPGAITANACAADLSVTVTGAAVGAECVVGLPATVEAGILANCYVSAADTVKLRICNHTGASVTPASADYSVRVFNP